MHLKISKKTNNIYNVIKMIIVDSIHAFRETYHWIRYPKKIENPEDLKYFILSLAKCSNSLVLIFLLSQFGRVIYFAFANWNNIGLVFLIDKIREGKQTLFAFVICSIVYYILHCSIKRIEKLKNDEDLISQKINDKISNIYSLIIRNASLTKNNFEVSFEYFAKLANQEDSYRDFIVKFQEMTNLKKEPLDNITDIASLSNNGKFLCVIAYEGYYTNKEDETKEMVQYFAKFDKITNQNNNIVRRIFTHPGEKGEGSNYQILKSVQEHESYITLQYLIINYVCGVDTYLLVYNNNDSRLFGKIFIKSDYVIAYHSFAFKEKNYNELFFAYPEYMNLAQNQEAERKPIKNNQSIRTQDTFFLKVFEQDFQNRMDFNRHDTTPTTMIRFNYSNYNAILKILRIDKNKAEVKALVNNSIQNLETWVQQDDNLDDNIVTRFNYYKL